MAAVRDGHPIVLLEDVQKQYELGGIVTALDGINLSLAAGSYTAIMGPSGSGKSTLLNLIGALDTPTAGTVTVDGTNIAALSESKRARLRGTEIGFVFQTFNLMPRLSAQENVELPLVFAEWERQKRAQRARELLERVGLGERLQHMPQELSGGQRQRVAIARALAADPTLMLVDEPTGNVDTETGSEIMSLFEDAHNRGNTILLVTHERRIAEHANRIVHLKDGKREGVEDLREDS